MIGFFNGTNNTFNIYNSVEYGNSGNPINVTANMIHSDHYLSDRTNFRTIAYNSSFPLFESDGYTPSRGSQVIDAGDNTLVTSTVDFNGEDRIQGDTVDLGAVEYLLPAIEGLRFVNNSPQSNPIIYEDNATYPVDELVEVEGVEEGDTVNYEVESILYGGNDIPVIDLPGTYNITATVSRFGFRKSKSVNTVAIKKNTGTIRVMTAGYVGEEFGVELAAPVDAQGYVTCTTGNQTYTGSISSGRCVIYLRNLSAGAHTVLITAHCTNYTDISATETITVSKSTMTPTTEAQVDDYGIYIRLYDVPSDYEENVSCSLGGNTYTISLAETKEFTLPLPSSGTYSYNVVFPPSYKYEGTTVQGSVVVSKLSCYFTLSAVVDNDETYIQISDLPSDFEGDATCTFNGETATISLLATREFTMTTPSTTGYYNCVVEVFGSSKYTDASQTSSVHVVR